ncbi:MAG: hypothetical protein ACREMO_09060, partial [Gemmatimonadales bacterium]
SAQSGQRAQAKQRGMRALQRLRPLSDQLQQQREQVQREWREEVVAALDRALAETSRLTQRQVEVADALGRGDTSPGTMASEGALEEGVQRLLDQLRDAAGKNALVSPRSSAALSAAKDEMRRSREAVAFAIPNTAEAAERSGQAIDALNAAAYDLVRNRGEMAGSGSGSGLAEALEKMGQMAGEQGRLGQQAGGLLPMIGSAGAIQEQLRQLAARQRALGEALERLMATGNAPGAGAMADEAKELARRLEAGRIDRATVERQERLFRRMLDAGRSLQGQEEDEKKERQSTTAAGDSVHLPPALRARLGEDAATRLPSWEVLQQLSPEERRLVVEYFRRLSGQGSGTP